MYLPDSDNLWQLFVTGIYLVFVFIGYGILKALKWLFPKVGEMLLKALSQALEDFVSRIISKLLSGDLTNIKTNVHQIKNEEAANKSTADIAIAFMKEFYENKGEIEKFNELVSRSKNTQIQLILLVENAKK